MVRLPKVILVDEPQAIVAYFDTCTATGRRDLAMTRCMSDLGLRVSEVVAVTLDNIDWRSGTMTIQCSKGDRGRTLAMPSALGQAIAAYLQKASIRRPSPILASYRSSGDMHGPHAGSWCFCHAYAKATGNSHSVGTHILRHTAATRTRSEGRSMKTIADVLGHRSVDTTTIYAKLDFESLRTTALPRPGGRS